MSARSVTRYTSCLAVPELSPDLRFLDTGAAGPTEAEIEEAFAAAGFEPAPRPPAAQHSLSAEEVEATLAAQGTPDTPPQGQTE
ncbi:hypothetical protein ACFOY4_30750 [Actinomadura syzygii]|uniref:Uncharacterized protein n=1 Tax=Actinomadura syzygii TaxID=1427538 RepID=A0A5D0TTQ5_9ACTN|nr:hypothetical protein [Actinomadura syzygii]TYC08705.1 hypothetical protein FXF65_38155 [Actinomadura syzygii]